MSLYHTFNVKSSFSLDHIHRLSPHRNSMTNTHHIDSNAGIKPVHLSYPRHFIRRQTYSDCQQSVLSVGQQSKVENSRLQKCSKANGYDLLAPAVKAVGVAPRNSEHIQAPDSYLAKHYAASLDVCKYNFYRAVAEQNYEKQAEQRYIRGKSDYDRKSRACNS